VQAQRNSISGHVFVVARKRGDQWYAKWRGPKRLADGRVVTVQTQQRLGPAWSGHGRPPEGQFTRKTAQAWLQAKLTDLRRGEGIPVEQASVPFRVVAEDWYAHGETVRGLKASTLRDYRSVLDAHVLPAFGEQPIEAISARMIEAWRSRGLADGTLTRRPAVKAVMVLHGISERARRAYGLATNPVAAVERLRDEYDPGEYDFYSPTEVRALVRDAASEQDGAIFLTAAFTGQRMGELLALRWRDIDFEAETIRVFGSVDGRAGRTTPKSGHGRSVPMIADVAQALARLGQRERFTERDDLVFPNAVGEFMDKSALRRRYKQAIEDAELRPIRFHELRHTFGSLAINAGSIVEVQHWLGHADTRTTSRYLELLAVGRGTGLIRSLDGGAIVSHRSEAWRRACPRPPVGTPVGTCNAEAGKEGGSVPTTPWSSVRRRERRVAASDGGPTGIQPRARER
jgi:integrase